MSARSGLVSAIVACAALGVHLSAHVRPSAQATPSFRLAIAGLVHGHAGGFLRLVQGRSDVQIVGVFEPDVALQRSYAQRFQLDSSMFFTDLASMLDRTKPEAVASFSNTYDHAAIVEAAAARGVDVMMEKPLAVSVEHAARIKRAAEAGRIDVLVNYETTWYASHFAMWSLIKGQRAAGEIRKMVAMDGHKGPKEINVGPEFLAWLTDPEKNGAGALFDFGCYGANLMTWMMDNRRPLTVTAITQQFKPQIYTRVDDEATILLEYPSAQGIIQASWNWPYDRKDFEVYGATGLAVGSRTALRVRMGTETAERTLTPDPLPADERDSISHLIAVSRGGRRPNALSSLENNLIVTEILSAARESARTHKAVALGK
jgi:predicted dehydrogenase